MAETFHEIPAACADCGPTVTNPKMGLNGYSETKRRRCQSVGEYICDPIVDEIRDVEKALKMAYTRYPVVPFFDGADATLSFFRKMKEQSPTHGTCIERIGVYTFGEGLKVVRKKRAGFVLADEDNEVTDAEANTFIDFIEALNPSMDGDVLLTEMWQSHENYKTYGNYLLRVDMVEVAGSRFVYFKVIDCEEWRYKLTRANEPRVVMVSPLWTLDYINRNPPEFLPVYPRVEKTARGVLSTVIHIRNNTLSRPWYGIPDSFQSLRYQLLEAQLGQYGTENYANDFVPRIIIEVEGDSERDGDDGFDKAITQTYTNRGRDRKRVVVRTRQQDEKPMFVHETKPNTDHQFHTATSTEAQRQIVKAHGWHNVLLGAPTPGRLGETQEFQQIYRMVNFATIRPHRQELLSGWHKALALADQYMNGGTPTVTATMSLTFDDLFKDFLEATIQEDRGTTGEPTNVPDDGFDG